MTRPIKDIAIESGLKQALEAVDNGWTPYTRTLKEVRELADQWWLWIPPVTSEDKGYWELNRKGGYFDHPSKDGHLAVPVFMPADPK